jgi:hypothetical protein
MKIDETFSTDGTGIWSNAKRAVKVTEMYLDVLGELRVYFDTASWDVATHSLIYTDRGWLKDLHKFLLDQGFSPSSVASVDYSEAGMQGNDYVSLDVGPAFIAQWRTKP